ncbi:hypothetical protein A3B56_02000 [Candidatus Roizmanbacteria bacterium RIFCSPLOWO2_01_FULL_45_11]|uniref:Uncharacterized protein n=1 Tax=Candidatus Roizmanbacteria bacterium RIFCSPLOWO2_01_FULL_45_11 TaxID=1802070 RepID=A0A1F7JIY9_9BACT|nr:MAG: hypothetical protein A3B56_02000 [Candidatus Roizmanbacteria bacterium RIFCSPLOWO2_01_FULL_45_11]
MSWRGAREPKQPSVDCKYVGGCIAPPEFIDIANKKDRTPDEQQKFEDYWAQIDVLGNPLCDICPVLPPDDGTSSF